MSYYERIAQIIRYLDESHTEQPDLSDLAERAGLSPYHFHRLFSEWAAITPKDFLQCLTLAHAKVLLRRGESVLDASYEAGLSGPGRLHDLCVHLEAASPGELKSGGEGWTILAGFAESPFGTCLIGESPRGICHLSFATTTDREVGAVDLRRNWPNASIEWDDIATAGTAARIFSRSSDAPGDANLRAIVRGTPFQVRVWRALLEIPSGSLVSYGGLAEKLHRPGAARAVGTAVGRNSLAYLIPCHRVIRETGAVGGYRWGVERKRAMIAWESSARSEKETVLSFPR
jgi:AraC family transcriptional regulator of adaptative response/methylated-DNA-[protein]-cysteine methyltransferase